MDCRRNFNVLFQGFLSHAIDPLRGRLRSNLPRVHHDLILREPRNRHQGSGYRIKGILLTRVLILIVAERGDELRSAARERQQGGAAEALEEVIIHLAREARASEVIRAIGAEHEGHTIGPQHARPDNENARLTTNQPGPIFARQHRSLGDQDAPTIKRINVLSRRRPHIARQIRLYCRLQNTSKS